MPGYQPTAENTGNLPQAAVIYNEKKFIDNLKPYTPFVRCTSRQTLPLNSGNQIQRFMYTPLGGNTTQIGEGAVGSPITISVQHNLSTVGQYGDYINLSDVSMETAIDEGGVLNNIRVELANRLAQTLSLLVRNTADAANSIDSSVNTQLSSSGTISIANCQNAVSSLLGRNVKPFDVAAGRFCAITHPFAVGDMVTFTGSTTGSIANLAKFTTAGQDMLKELPGTDTAEVIDWFGLRFYTSTLVTQTPNYLSSGKTAYRTYIFGQDGVLTTALGSNSGIGDGELENLKINLVANPPLSAADPVGVIGGWTSYNTKFVPSLPPDVTMRLRTLDAPSNIS